MSTGNINLDILLEQIRKDAISGNCESLKDIQRRYPSLSEKETTEIHTMISAALQLSQKEQISLVVTAPPSFAIKAMTTRVTVNNMLEKAKNNILITGYSLSDYFSDMLDKIIHKSQSGIFVKFFVNNIEQQNDLIKLQRYKGKFLKIYNYQNLEDQMSALHAKVISVDGTETLITSANLSYHGQEGNIELGTHIVSQEIATQVNNIFTQLIFKKIFSEI